MADDNLTLRNIDWRNVFPFVRLMRAFRVAVHPSKLVLALLAIVIIYLAGRGLDSIWPREHRAVPLEIESIYQPLMSSGSGHSFRTRRAEVRQQVVDRAQQLRTQMMDLAREQGESVTPETFTRSQLRQVLLLRRDRAIEAARASFDALPDKTRAASRDLDAKIRAAYAESAQSWQIVRATDGQGLLNTFIQYQAEQIDQAALGILRFDWLGSDGVFSRIYRFVIVGPTWALGQHPLYFALLLAIALPVWAVIGGAVSRIAAVHVARDEKVSVRQALRFSTHKLLSFLTAPLLPLLLVGITGLVFGFAGWLSELQLLRIGSIWTVALSASFVVVILVSILVACTLFGTIAGFGLMYPTIAVEGSDSFDAISRSFSYVFARPWKMAFFCLIGLVHGAITYLFLRFMVLVTLVTARWFLTAFTADIGPDGTTSIANAWPGPSGLLQLTPPIDSFALTGPEKVASTLVMFWVYLFVALLGAYVLSLYITTNTIIYYLLRNDVDATQFDDVYLEQTDDDLEEELADEKPAAELSAAPKPDGPSETS
jgi:hypothetical protein